MKRRITIIAIIIVILGLMTWRLWPNSIYSIMPVNADNIASLSGHASILQFNDNSDDVYRIEASQSEDSFKEVLEILDMSGYQRDYRNLLPWGIDYVDADKNYDGHTLSLLFVWGEEKDKCIHIQFLSHSIVAVSTPEKPGFRIYHPTNSETLYDLIEYVQTHGKERKLCQ